MGLELLDGHLVVPGDLLEGARHAFLVGRDALRHGDLGDGELALHVAAGLVPVVLAQGLLIGVHELAVHVQVQALARQLALQALHHQIQRGVDLLLADLEAGAVADLVEQLLLELVFGLLVGVGLHGLLHALAEFGEGFAAADLPGKFIVGLVFFLHADLV